MRVSIQDGKYTIVQEGDGNLHCLRNGEPWRDCVGDKLVYCLAAEIEHLRETVGESRDGPLEVWKFQTEFEPSTSYVVASVDNLLEHLIAYASGLTFCDNEQLVCAAEALSAELERLQAVHAASYAACGRSLEDERAGRRKRQAEALAELSAKADARWKEADGVRADRRSNTHQHAEPQVEPTE